MPEAEPTQAMNTTPAPALDELTPQCYDCMSRWGRAHIQAPKPYSAPLSIDECPICHEAFDNDEHAAFKIVDVPTCPGHIFGLKCIIGWIINDLENSNTCPMCRGELFKRKSHGEIEMDGDVEVQVEEDGRALRITRTDIPSRSSDPDGLRQMLAERTVGGIAPVPTFFPMRRVARARGNADRDANRGRNRNLSFTMEEIVEIPTHAQASQAEDEELDSNDLPGLESSSDTSQSDTAAAQEEISSDTGSAQEDDDLAPVEDDAMSENDSEELDDASENGSDSSDGMTALHIQRTRERLIGEIQLQYLKSRYLTKSVSVTTNTKDDGIVPSPTIAIRKTAFTISVLLGFTIGISFGMTSIPRLAVAAISALMA